MARTVTLLRVVLYALVPAVACGSDVTTVDPVASVSVTPTAAHIAPAATLQFSAVLKDAAGNVLRDRTILWSTSDASIATVNQLTGLVTGVRSGDVTVSATSEGKSGSVAASVTAEPAGMTRISESSFDCVKATPCTSDWEYQEFGNGSVASVVADASAPKSPPSVARVLFPAGLVGGAGVGQLYRSIGTYRTLYISAWIKFSPTWIGNPTGNNKMLYLFLDGQTALITEATGALTASLQPTIFLQNLGADYPWYPDPFGTPHSTPFPTLEANTGSAEIIRGQWHRYEYVINIGTPGVANGTLSAWLDGKKTHEFAGIMWRPAGSAGNFDYIQWEPIWGGNLGILAVDQFQYLDHIYISGK